MLFSCSLFDPLVRCIFLNFLIKKLEFWAISWDSWHFWGRRPWFEIGSFNTDKVSLPTPKHSKVSMGALIERAYYYAILEEGVPTIQKGRTNRGSMVCLLWLLRVLWFCAEILFKMSNYLLTFVCRLFSVNILTYFDSLF